MADVLDLPDPPMPNWNKKQIEARKSLMQWCEYVFRNAIEQDLIWWHEKGDNPMLTIATAKHTIEIVIDKRGYLNCDMYPRVAKPGHTKPFGPFFLLDVKCNRRNFFESVLPQILVTTLEEIDFEIKAMERGKDC